jgi:hypothetical protein
MIGSQSVALIFGMGNWGLDIAIVADEAGASKRYKTIRHHCSPADKGRNKI